MRHSPDTIPETTVQPGHLRQIRGAVAAAILAIIMSTGCEKNRMGMHIEIKDRAANTELENLRREFEIATQHARYDSQEEKNEKITEILEKRDNLLRSSGIPAKTERWYESGNSADGPFMAIRVDKPACQSVPTCKVKPANSDFPEINGN